MAWYFVENREKFTFIFLFLIVDLLVSKRKHDINTKLWKLLCYF